MFSIVHLVLCLLKSLVSKMLTEFELSDTLFQFFCLFVYKCANHRSVTET